MKCKCGIKWTVYRRTRHFQEALPLNEFVTEGNPTICRYCPNCGDELTKLRLSADELLRSAGRHNALKGKKINLKTQADRDKARKVKK